MRFDYEYRTSDNVRHVGVICASNRDAAFAALRKCGIRPGRMVESPGLFNKLFGKGKRWLAIAFLAMVLSVALYVVWQDGKTIRNVEDVQTYEPRGQLFGDPVLLARISSDDWREVFAEAGDRFLANHAIPGRECGCRPGVRPSPEIVERLERCRTHLLAIPASDLEEVARIKRKVNWMKRELNEYVADGGSVKLYVERLHQRAKAEMTVLNRVRTELKRADGRARWDEENATLRRMGLPMVPVDDFPQ